MNRKLIFCIALFLASLMQAQNPFPIPPDQNQCSGADCPPAQSSEENGSEHRRNESVPTLPTPSLNQPNRERLTRAVNAGRRKAAPVPMERRPTEPNEFQKYVFSTTGVHLPMYGRNLFTTVPSTFAPVDHVAVPSSYVIGPGDELLVRVWGQVDYEGKLVVDRGGQIFIPKVGAINVAGVQYDQLEDFLKVAISKFFKNFNLSVSLGQLRSIQIFVVGHAKQPGAYTISSLSSLVNALFASGGPDETGSMRDIELKRNDKLVTKFDVYDLLLKGDKSKDALLQPGDVIYVAPIGRLVAVTGAVNLPGVYELGTGGTVDQLIDMAGGLNTIAENGRARLERVDHSNTRTVEQFTLDKEGMDRQLQDGDILTVFTVSPKFDNAVTLRGNVANPGRYPWKSGMRVRDLIPTRESIITPQYWIQKNALGLASSGWPSASQNAPSAVESPSARTANQESGLSDIGPGSQQLQNGPAAEMTGVSPENRQWQSVRTRQEQGRVKRLGTEINWEYAVVQRMNPEDLSSQLLPFNLAKAIDDAASADNLPLQPGDVVTIFSQADIEVPAEKQTKFVRIEGEVKAPGIYRAQPGETLRDLVRRAGGLTNSAYLFAADFRRESTRLEQRKHLDEVVAEMDRDLQLREANLNSGPSDQEQAFAQEQLQQARAAVERLRAVEPTGRIVLDLKPTDTDISAIPPLPLEDGDHLFIPRSPATVEVVGAVYSPSTFLFEDGKTLRQFVSRSGGALRDADAGRVFVIRANGAVLSRQNHRSIWMGSFDSLRLLPGDVVVMPQRIKTTTALREIRDWSQVFAQFALGAAAIKVIGQ